MNGGKKKIGSNGKNFERPKPYEKLYKEAQFYSLMRKSERSSGRFTCKDCCLQLLSCISPIFSLLGPFLFRSKSKAFSSSATLFFNFRTSSSMSQVVSLNQESPRVQIFDVRE